MEYDDMARLTYTSNAIKARLTPTLHSTAISAHLSPQTRHQTTTDQSFEAIHSMLQQVLAVDSLLRLEDCVCYHVCKVKVASAAHTHQRDWPSSVTCEMSHGMLQEAMRMLPVLADGTNRTTTADIRLGSYTIPKGTMVWVPLMGLFNSPRNWADPDKYMPVEYPLTAPVRT